MSFCWSYRKWILAYVTLLIVSFSGIVEAKVGESDQPNQPSKPFTAEQIRFFEDEVRPILTARCIKCHGGSGKIRGNFRLDGRAAVLKGGDLGPAVNLDLADESVLLHAIRYEELEMPPGGKLPQGEIDVLTRWVKEGVPWTSRPEVSPPGVRPAATTTGSGDSIAGARRQWSYLPVVRPKVPASESFRLGPQSGRFVHPLPTRSGATPPGAGGRPYQPDPAVDL